MSQEIFQTLYRPRLDITINWHHLMSRSNFKGNNAMMEISSKLGEGNWNVLKKAFSLDNKGVPFYQDVVNLEYHDEVPHLISLKLINPSCKDKKLLEPLTFSLQTMMFEQKQYQKFTFIDSKPNCPDIVLFGDWRKKDNYRYEVDLKCQNVKDIEWMSKSDPYIKILKLKSGFKILPSNLNQLPSSNWEEIYISEFKQDNLNPDFAPFILYSGLACNNDPNWPLRLEVWDYEESRPEAHNYLGHYIFTIQDLSKGLTFFETRDFEGEKTAKVIVEKFETVRQYDLMDYLQDGLEINNIICIDFSSSNGDPNDNSSLHRMTGISSYEKAIDSIAPALFKYDSDKKIPTFGFGAKFPTLDKADPDGQKNFFKLIGRGSSSKVPMDTMTLKSFYKSAFSFVKGSEPSLICPTIKGVVDFVEANMKNPRSNQLNYTVVVVFTDGEIDDIKEACHHLVRASKLPISFVFVGIGKGNFKMMEYLDNDNGKKMIDNNDNYAVRDMVQFIKFTLVEDSPAEAVNKALFELPYQIVGYYLSNNILPGSR